MSVANQAAAAPSATLPSLKTFRRIVIKVGSSLLIDREQGCVKRSWLVSLAEDIADLHAQGADLLVVSSGAIALGRTVLRPPRTRLETRGQPGRRRRGPDRLGANLGGSARG